MIPAPHPRRLAARVGTTAAGGPVKKCDATKDEYMLGLRRLETQRGFPSHAVNALLRYQEMVAQDNCKLAWATIHCYSEEIFTRVADGATRLP